MALIDGMVYHSVPKVPKTTNTLLVVGLSVAGGVLLLAVVLAIYLKTRNAKKTIAQSVEGTDEEKLTVN